MSDIRLRRAVAAALVATVLAACDGDDPSGDAGLGMDASRDDAGPADAAGTPAPTRPCETVDLRELVPAAARFDPGARVTLRVQARNPGAERCSVALRFVATQLGRPVHDETREVTLEAGEERTAELTWQPPPDDFTGYMAIVSAPGGAAALSTGVDVSSTPVRYPRYGYVSVFPPQSREQSFEIIDTLAQNFHLNMFQMYDWFWRHEDLIPPSTDGQIPATWNDLFGRELVAETIADLTDAIHEENAWAMAYVAIYAAREGYEQQSAIPPAWGLFQTPNATQQEALAFGGERTLFLFDPSNAGWQARMVDEYVDAIRTFDFDGVHIDQFGPRPTLYRADGTPVELNQTFPPFLEAIDQALTAQVPGRDACVFNLVDGAVDGYAVREVATSPACDFLYSELWFTTDTYEDVRRYVEQLRAIGRGRAVVVAVYPQYGEDVGRILQAEEASLQGVAIDTDHEGFTGSGFVDQFDEVGDSITWTVELDELSTVSFVIRYANATGERATRTLLLDGEVLGTLSFGARERWEDWAFDAWLQRRVEPGPHTIELRYAESDVGAINVDRLTLGEFDEQSVRLQNAVIFASGATPIQLGDDVQSLSHEYFPNRSRSLTPSLQRALRRQYAFITAHESILFAPDVTPIDARLARIEAVSPGPTLITEGTGGLWTVLRQTPAGQVIHLVNLVGLDNARWRDSAPSPEPQEGVVLRYRVEGPVSEVLLASPDEGTGAFEPIPFTRGEGYVELTVPRLEYWDVILVR